jgi:hypothetical protein
VKAATATARDEESALEEFHRRGWTDGLPVVIPTPGRVEAMVLASGLAPELVLSKVGPGFGDATVEKVAANAVMAGCLPEHLPVVIAALKAVCDERFDLATLQATTHAIGPVLIVNGPAREACGGIASGWGCLGPGYRANAVIGRALRLVMINVGGARPGTTDMAVMGSPAKFTCCFAEAEETSPFPPLHVSRGFKAEQSAVTVVGVEAPHSVIMSTSGDDPDGPERMLRTLAGAIANAGSNNTYSGAGTTLVVLNPVHARAIARRYATREQVQQRLYELAVTPQRVLDGYARMDKSKPGSEEKLIHAIGKPERVVVAVAGGEGIYSAVFNTWGGGAHAVETVSSEIELNQYCELPARAAS